MVKKSQPPVTTTISTDPGPSTTTTKTTVAKINERLDEVISHAPPTKNRSPELVPLTAEYEKMRKNRMSQCF